MFLYIIERGLYVNILNYLSHIHYLNVFIYLYNFIMIFSVTAAEVAEDSSLLAVGFSDSTIKIWSLIPQKLRLMKTAEQLQDIDREAGNIYVFEKMTKLNV